MTTYFSSVDRNSAQLLSPETQRISIRTLFLVVLALAFIPFMFFAGHTQANAHDVLVDQTPAEGEVFDAAPESITLSFNNELLDVGTGATIINVSDASGTELDLGEPQVVGRDAVLSIDELDDGAYRTVWSVVSSDGHRIAGEFFFAVGADSADELTELQASVGTDATEQEHEHDHGDEEHGDHEHDSDTAAPVDAEADATDSEGLGTGVIIALSIAGIGVVAVMAVLIWRKSQSSL